MALEISSDFIILIISLSLNWNEESLWSVIYNWFPVILLLWPYGVQREAKYLCMQFAFILKFETSLIFLKSGGMKGDSLTL